MPIALGALDPDSFDRHRFPGNCSCGGVTHGLAPGLIRLLGCRKGFGVAVTESLLPYRHFPERGGNRLLKILSWQLLEFRGIVMCRTIRSDLVEVGVGTTFLRT
ncbi:hypothetical protein GCM10009555_024340 [Acrocarpospora macrocephala]